VKKPLTLQWNITQQKYSGSSEHREQAIKTPYLLQVCLSLGNGESNNINNIGVASFNIRLNYP